MSRLAGRQAVTIALSIKVNDGVVLAADSASSMIDENGTVLNIYNNANKVFNLLKGHPIGGVTWGAGNIGAASIATLAKDLRRRLLGSDPAFQDWKLDLDSYAVEEVAQRVKEFMYDDLYVAAFGGGDERPPLGFTIAGYSAGEGLAEVYLIEIDGQGNCNGPTLVCGKDVVGMLPKGQPETILRLVVGFGSRLPEVLVDQFGLAEDDVGEAMDIIGDAMSEPILAAAMPIQDAIDLAEFLVDTTIRFSRFAFVPPTVGGPVEIAAITKHEGFKWVRRKHYFPRDLNWRSIQWEP